MEHNDRKTLLVLGASSDIGQALIAAVGDAYDVILAHYRKDDGFLCRLKNETSASIVGYQADFDKFGEVEMFVEWMKKEGYQPDDIVHLPAVSAKPVKFHKESYDVYERAMRVSVDSIVYILQNLLPGMIKKKRGKILFMLTAYVSGRPPKGESVYVTSKYALLGLMRSLSADYADKNIQVNAVSPEMTETKFLSDISEHIVEQNAASSPMKRNLYVEDVIPTMVYLLSEAGDCVTGENITITGGR